MAITSPTPMEPKVILERLESVSATVAADLFSTGKLVKLEPATSAVLSGQAEEDC